jgi:hypothetical protein
MRPFDIISGPFSAISNGIPDFVIPLILSFNRTLSVFFITTCVPSSK